jgi:D-alanyl-D-alanine dipeptidase
MLMVDIMQWVAKKYLAFLGVLFLALAAIALALIWSKSDAAAKDSREDSGPTICFEVKHDIAQSISAPMCTLGQVDLGNRALTESATADGIVDGLHPLLLARFEAARSAALLEGIHLYISSGFRTRDRQAELFVMAIKKYGSETEAAKWVLPAQFSHHPHGLAIDVNYPGDPQGAKWLELNGYRFGLCRVYSNEWWHFEGIIAPGDACPAMSPDARVDLG